jgi:hypothetical protein
LTNKESKNLLLDHIYTHGEVNLQPATVSLTGPYPIPLGNNKTDLKPLSDHYAVESFINNVPNSSNQSKFGKRSEIKSSKKVF